MLIELEEQNKKEEAEFDSEEDQRKWDNPEIPYREDSPMEESGIKHFPLEELPQIPYTAEEKAMWAEI